MMVKTCPRCGTTYEDGGRFCRKDGATLRSTQTAELAPGSLVDGRYEIVRRLGGGGMGVVYLVEDIRLRRPSALKILRAGSRSIDVESAARFYREATNVSQINHPHVVAVYNFDETDEGLIYLATEYVEGESLDSRLDAVSLLSPRPTARIVWQIANGLEAAHRLRIAHRDLKPGNVMLTDYGQWKDFVKVVDFGIAKAFGTTAGSALTTEGMWVGTPAYMSPEQWRSAEVDHRSDVYSLGLMTVRMLAGGLPPDRGPGGESADKLLSELPPNDWPEGLINVLGRCLAPDVDERFQSASEFSSSLVRAVEAWIPPDPTSREPWDARVSLTTPDGPREDNSAEAEPTLGPRRTWRVASVAVGTLIIVAFAYWGIPWSSPPARDIEDPPADAAVEATEPEEPVTGTASVPDPIPSEPQPASDGAPPPLPEAVASVDLPLQRLRSLIDLSNPDVDSMRAATRLAEDLLSQPLSEPERLEIGYRLAEANLFLGNRAEGCVALGQILAAAEASETYSRAVQALLDANCEPDG